MFGKTVVAFLVTTAVAVGGSFASVGAASQVAAAPQVMRVQMRAQAFSGVSGTATLSYNAATKMTTVKVSVHNLQPGSVHPSHIHAGVCSANGPVLAALASVTANAKGSGSATTVIPGSFMHTHAYVNVHLGPGLALTQYTVLTCGELGTGK